MVMSETMTQAWSILRLLRSDPPLEAAGDAHRRRTFSAALEQAEGLWRAAAGVSSAASPIILFYSLAQGASALCAARITDGQWEAVPSHGLTLRRPDTENGKVLTLSDIWVESKGEGLVHQAARLFGSPVLSKKARLGEVLCTLPQQEEFFLRDGYEEHLRPLVVRDGTGMLGGADTPSNEVAAVIGPLPPGLLTPERVGDKSVGMVELTLEEVVPWLSSYPALASAGRPSAIGHLYPMELTRNPDYGVRVCWTLPHAIPWGSSSEWFSAIVDIVEHHEPGVYASGKALPSIGGNKVAQHPLISWWIVLYACSMLARYHPRTWVALLDVDNSASAVPLDRILQVAREQLPILLLEAVLPNAADSASGR